MPVNSTHPSYDAAIDKWQRCRDAYEGEDAVKGRGKGYLPMPGGMEPDQFKNYVTRALYYEAVGRTVDGFVGAIVRKPPTINVPEALIPLIEDVTGDGLDIIEFTKLCCAETMLVGRCGLLVDFDDDTQRPYIRLFQAEAIRNWSDNSIVLFEKVYEADAKDAFKTKAIDQYRQLSVEDGRYTVHLWRKKDADLHGSEWLPYEETTPTNRGRSLDAIPFFWLSNYGGTSRIDKPPLLGLVNVALSHYRNSADLEHGRHFTGLPTLYVTGQSPEDGVAIGPTSVILCPDANSKVGYAEFSGQGLKSLEVALETKEQKMAALGAAVFTDQRSSVETAETARIRNSGETSLLMAVVSAVEKTLEQAFACAASWWSVTGEIDIDLNRDFIDSKLDPQMMTALTAAYQAGTISLDTYLYNIQKAEMLPPNRTIDEEKEAIATAQAEKETAADAAVEEVTETDGGEESA